MLLKERQNPNSNSHTKLLCLPVKQHSRTVPLRPELALQATENEFTGPGPVQMPCCFIWRVLRVQSVPGWPGIRKISVGKLRDRWDSGAWPWGKFRDWWAFVLRGR